MKFQKGFTLLEGLITIVILAVFIFGFIYVFVRISETAREGIQDSPLPVAPNVSEENGPETPEEPEI